MITFRFVSREDCELLFGWRNDPATRKNSFNTNEIDWQTHQQWFEKKIYDPASIIYIVLNCDGKPVGQVRFDISKEKEGIVNVSIDQKYRAQGYATESLRKLCPLVMRSKKFRRIVAYVKPLNIASYHLFERAGFQFVGSSQCNGNLCNVFTFDLNL